MHIFEITIQRRWEGRWPVVVEERETGVRLPDRTEGFLELDPESDPAADGQALGRALFHGKTLEAFTRASARDDDLHVLLFVEAEDESLRRLRWERLHAPVDGGWRPLALEPRRPFSQYLPASNARGFPPIGRDHLRALIVAANPDAWKDYGLKAFDEAEAVGAVRGALAGRVEPDLLGTLPGSVGPPTLDALCARLTADSYALLHVICHGAHPPDAGEPVLYLASSSGSADPVAASRLLGRLGSLRRLPHLVFLSSCSSAGAGAEGALGGLAHRLVRNLGVPAVVAMTDRVSVETARVLAEAFYRRLLEHGEVDRALAEGFAGVAERLDVAVPVPALFSRLDDRRLFAEHADRALTEDERRRGLDLITRELPRRGQGLAEEFAEARESGEAAVNAFCGEIFEQSFRSIAERGAGALVGYDGRCPFLGLYAFRPEDHEFFFGREPLVGALADAIAAHPFLAVLGASGSGKSSLVLGGLLPRLGRPYAVITPGADPPAALDAALPGLGDGSLLVVDQFEEVFTLCGDEARRRAFFDRLLTATPGRSVVLTMRADFWGECFPWPYQRLADEIDAHHVRVAPMDTPELRRAMELQAAGVNLRFEAGLAAALLDDVAGEPAAMPLLQHALREVWERRRGRWLKAGAYEAIGRVKGALARTADTLFESLPGDDQRRVRDVFLRLTRLGDDAPGVDAPRRDTRRRVLMSELVPGGGDPSATRALVARLADRRLVVVDGDDRVEVGHEALIRHWPRLRAWVDEDPALLRRREEIADASRAWQGSGRSADLLVHVGVRLTEAEALVLGGRVDLNAAERDYVEACAARRDAERIEREARQRREVRRFRTWLRVVSALGAVAAVLGVLAALASARARKAEDLARDEVVRLDVKNGIRLMNGDDVGYGDKLQAGEDLSGSLLWLVEALKNEGPDPAKQERLRVPIKALLNHLARPSRVWYHPGPAPISAMSPDGRLVLTASGSGTVRVWDVNAWKSVSTWKLDKVLRSAVFSPDGRRVALIGLHDRDITLWDTATGRSVATFRHVGGSSAATFSPDGRRVVTSGRDKKTRVWDSETGAPVGRPVGHEFPARSASFSPDGAWLLTVSDAGGFTRAHEPYGRVDLLDATSGDVKKTVTTTQVNVRAAFDSTGRRFVVVGLGHFSADVSVREFESPSGTLVSERTGVRGKVVDVAPDGRAVLTVEDGQVVRAWGSTGLILGATPPGEAVGGVSARFGPDGRRFVTFGGKAARVWDTSGRPLTPPMVHGDWLLDARFSPDGLHLLTTSRDGLTRLWDLSLDLPRIELNGEHGVSHATLSPDGLRVLTVGNRTGETAQSVVVWNAASGRQMTPPMTHPGKGYLIQAAFSPDGRRVLTALNDRTLVFWDAESGRRLRDFKSDGHPNGTKLSRDWGKLFTVDGGTIRVRDSSSGAELAAIGPLDPLHNYTTDPAGSRVVTVSGQKAVVGVWDATDGRPVGPSVGLDDGFQEAGFSLDARRMWTRNAGESSLRVWETTPPRPLSPIQPPGRIVPTVVLSPDGSRVLTVDKETGERLWDAASGRLVAPLNVDNGVILAAFAPDGRTVVTGTRGGVVQVWDANDGRPVSLPMRMQALNDPIQFSGDGRFLLLKGQDGAGSAGVRVWEAATGNPVTPLLDLAAGSRAEISGDGRRLLATSRGAAQVWDLSPDRTPVADLQQLARLITGHEIGGKATLVPARPEAILYDDAVVGRKYQPDLDPPAWAVLRWHRFEAERSTTEQEAFATAWHAERLVALEPDRPKNHAILGDALANQGLWARAARELTRATELGSDDVTDWSRNALARSRNHDTRGYREACALGLSRFRRTERPEVLREMVRACVLEPGAVDGLGAHAERLERLVPNPPKTYADVVGAAWYRAGDHNRAVEWLLKETAFTTQVEALTHRLFLAMSYHRLGRPEMALKWWHDAKSATGQDPATFDAQRLPAARWPERVFIQAVFSEAAAMFAEGPSTVK